MTGELDPSASELQLDPSLALAPDWYVRPVVDVARDLLGCLIVSATGDTLVAGVIVETEAYDGEDDPASHASFRRNGLVQAMWGPRGSLYVYRAYGVYPVLQCGRRPGLPSVGSPGSGNQPRSQSRRDGGAHRAHRERSCRERPRADGSRSWH